MVASFAVTEFRTLCGNIYECVCCYNRCHCCAVKVIFSIVGEYDFGYLLI
jgi:hypothetical protein